MMPANGGDASNGGVADVRSRIHLALEVVHSPQSTNAARLDAQAFLERLKDTAEAPLHGFELASDKSQSPIVRHYALSLLGHAIRHSWSMYTEEQAKTLRNWVLELSQAVFKDDPPYLRNKIAQLWVDIAKRCWGVEWLDMDFMLVQLWQIPNSPAHKELVMSILETLSDEIFNADDSVFVMREGILSKACVEIFTPTAVLAEAFPNRQAGPPVRHGDEGWLSRLSDLLNYCLSFGCEVNEETKTYTIKAFSVFLSLMPWAIPKAISSARCVPAMAAGLASPFIEVQKAALNALHALYCRSNFTDSEFHDLVVPMYSASSVELCKRIFDWSTTSPDDIDEEKYQINQRFSEMLSNLGHYFNLKYSQLPPSTAPEAFLQLLLQAAQSQSLLVSIPVLVAWIKLLGNEKIGKSNLVTPLIGPLLEVCSSRLLRYENLPGNTTDPTYLFICEDADTIPERHALLGNYRRYCSQIIETIVQLKLVDAVSHVLGRAEHLLRHLYDGQPPFSKQNYHKHSMPVLQVDAQFTVIEATLKGFVKWRHRNVGEREQEKHELEANLEAWCKILFEMNFEDPMIRKRTLQLLACFSTHALPTNEPFMLKVLEHIILTWPAMEPEHRAFNDAIKDLQTESMHELHRIAMEVPDHLLGVYDQLEARVNEMMSSGSLDDKRILAYRSFLFLIIHRATVVDTDTKIQKLREFVEPVKAQWQNETTRSAVKSYSDFCELLALDKAQAYLVSRQAHMLQDWGSAELDAEGLALQHELEERVKQLPLRPTKTYLAFSVERMNKNSPDFQASCALWQEGLTNILADVLELLSYVHATHNPNNWTHLPAETRDMVDRVLCDRFWQAGISDGSKDDFYARVVDKKNTIEGLASTIRGTVRFVRETAYAIIYCMSRLDAQFYGFQGLSQPLAKALFTDSTWLSTHQQSNLLNLVRYLVDDCPIDYREQFLPHLIASCFQQIDAKLNAEWQKTIHHQIEAADGEAGLQEEMKAESILRQVTYTTVVMTADFLDPTKLNPAILRSRTEQAGVDSTQEKAYSSLRSFCLAHREIVEPLLLFCTHVIRMRDTRCCGMILRLFISLVPEFHTQGQESQTQTTDDGRVKGSAAGSAVPSEIASVIREYMSGDVLRACLSSFNEAYFVEVQKELASLIAAIVVHYSPLTRTPSEVLLALPNVNAEELERLRPFMDKPGSHPRQQRVIVLEFLKNLKGVSVSEMGKLGKGTSATGHKKNARSKMAQAFLSKNAPGDGTGGGEARRGMRATTDGLEGVASLFDGQ